MRFRKPKTDGERLADTVRELEKIRESYRRDPWSFIGAIMAEYHAIKKAAVMAGELESYQNFESKIAGVIMVEGVVVSGASPRMEPYR